MTVPVAFYAPMKAPTHPTPSGDREIARLTLTALERAGYAPVTMSELRTLDMAGSAERQAELTTEAEAEATRIIDALSRQPKALWFTYHCYYKAPDLLGPRVCDALDMPYVISEPSISPRRRNGAWAGFAAASDAAIARADLLLWTTERDRQGLEDAGHAARMRHLPAFVDPGHMPATAGPTGPLRLLVVAMMRDGDKLESYRRLARGLACLEQDWTLDVVGDGKARAEVEQALAPLAPRVSFHGAISEPATLRQLMEAADMFVWPGVNEGVGMVWLEAQAAGLPVIAEDHAAARDIVANHLAPGDDPQGFAAAIQATANDLPARASAARRHIDTTHSLEATADRLGDALKGVLQ